MVQTNTVIGPGGEAGVMRIKGTGRPDSAEGPIGEIGLAMALDGNGRWAYLDPKLGAMHAVAESARKVAMTGATPVAATNCLNFGNPRKARDHGPAFRRHRRHRGSLYRARNPHHRRQCLAL
jgi:phosphoribosylformylglycinamidine (FGAM) synthase-like enzyme